jgi:hypothetical protein
MFGPKHHNGIARYPNNAPLDSEEKYMPIDSITQRDVDTRELEGIIVFILGIAVAVAVFFILVFGILGAVADALGDALGLHQNYTDVVGRH